MFFAILQSTNVLNLYRFIDDAECELNCKPVGMRYFATLNRTVIDGTSCTKPTEHPNRQIRDAKAICVEGICKVSEK